MVTITDYEVSLKSSILIKEESLKFFLSPQTLENQEDFICCGVFFKPKD